MTGRRGRRKVCVGDRARRESTGGRRGRASPSVRGRRGAASSSMAGRRRPVGHRLPPLRPRCPPQPAAHLWPPVRGSRPATAFAMSSVWFGDGSLPAHGDLGTTVRTPGRRRLWGRRVPAAEGGLAPRARHAHRPCPPRAGWTGCSSAMDRLTPESPARAAFQSPLGSRCRTPRPRPLGSSRADPCSGTRPSFCFEGVKTKAAAGGGGRAPPRQQLGVGGAGEPRLWRCARCPARVCPLGRGCGACAPTCFLNSTHVQRRKSHGWNENVKWMFQNVLPTPSRAGPCPERQRPPLLP